MGHPGATGSQYISLVGAGFEPAPTERPASARHAVMVWVLNAVRWRRSKQGERRGGGECES